MKGEQVSRLFECDSVQLDIKQKVTIYRGDLGHYAIPFIIFFFCSRQLLQESIERNLIDFRSINVLKVEISRCRDLMF